MNKQTYTKKYTRRIDNLLFWKSVTKKNDSQKRVKFLIYTVIKIIQSLKLTMRQILLRIKREQNKDSNQSAHDPAIAAKDK